MKIRIDKNLCRGHGRCYDVAADVFTDDDEGYGQVIAAEVPDKFEEQARLAVASCPERAIVIG
jgi:ferredoxin